MRELSHSQEDASIEAMVKFGVYFQPSYDFTIVRNGDALNQVSFPAITVSDSGTPKLLSRKTRDFIRRKNIVKPSLRGRQPAAISTNRRVCAMPAASPAFAGKTVCVFRLHNGKTRSMGKRTAPKKLSTLWHKCRDVFLRRLSSVPASLPGEKEYRHGGRRYQHRDGFR